MFGKKDLVDNLSQDLDRARARREALACDVTSLGSHIAELEARLSQEKDRRDRMRLEREVDDIRKRVEDAAAKFAPAVANLCDATEAAVTLVPDARELSALLAMVASKVGGEVDALLGELRRRVEAVRTEGAVRSPPAPEVAPPPKKMSERVLPVLPAFLPRHADAGQTEG